jgi:hypothetical protein
MRPRLACNVPRVQRTLRAAHPACSAPRVQRTPRAAHPACSAPRVQRTPRAAHPACSALAAVHRHVQLTRMRPRLTCNVPCVQRAPRASRPAFERFRVQQDPHVARPAACSTSRRQRTAWNAPHATEQPAGAVVTAARRNLYSDAFSTAGNAPQATHRKQRPRRQRPSRQRADACDVLPMFRSSSFSSPSRAPLIAGR